MKLRGTEFGWYAKIVRMLLRNGLVLLLTVSYGFTADLRVDHVTVAGKDVSAMRQRLAAVGLPSEYGGKHTNRATEMAVVSFPDGSYLELIGMQPDPDPKMVALHPWAKFLTAIAEPCGWAARADDLQAEVKRLRAAGESVEDPTPGARRRPDGVMLQWETAQVGKEGNGAFFPFLIHDVSKRELRAFPSGKPNAPEFAGVSRVFVGVRDLNSAVDRYRKAYGFAAPRMKDDTAFGAKLAAFDGTPAVLAAPLDAKGWLAERIARFGEAPCAFVLRRKAGTATQITWYDTKALGWRLGVE
jgi:hypothetical protein